jgi:hypothetical protein
MSRRVVSVVVDDAIRDAIEFGSCLLGNHPAPPGSSADLKRNALQALFASILKVYRNPPPVRISHVPLNEQTTEFPSSEHDEIWRTRDGRQIRVCDMDDDHVRSTLNMLLRNRRRRAELKRELKAIERWTDETMEDEKKWGSS